ncbi:MAG: DUF4340 domain-containing protein [Candidatus Glassbacteria bacterium]
MKIRNTLILIVIAAGLFLYMYRVEIIGVRQKEEAAELAKKVMPYEPDSVQVLRVKTKESDVLCSRDDDGWKISEPVQTKGDANTIDYLLKNLSQISIERNLDEKPQGLEPYGLEAPSVAIHIEGNDFSSDTLYLGKKNPTGSFVYSKKSGDPLVFLLPQVSLSQLEKNLFDLRDKLVLGVDREAVEEFTIRAEYGPITCEKSDDEWYITEPVYDNADRGAVSRVLSSVSSGKAVEFVTEESKNLAAYGLDEPKATVDVYTGADKKKHTVIIGDQNERKYYAKDTSRAPIFCVNNIFWESVNQDVKDFRNKKIVDFNRTEVTSLELSGGGETIICEKDTTNKWFVIRAPSPEKVPALSNKVNQLMSTLIGMRAEEFIDGAADNLSAYGLDNPRLEVVLKGEEGELARVFFGKEKDENTYAKNALKETVYLVKKNRVDKLTVKYDDFIEEEKKDEGGESTE